VWLIPVRRGGGGLDVVSLPCCLNDSQLVFQVWVPLDVRVQTGRVQGRTVVEVLGERIVVGRMKGLEVSPFHDHPSSNLRIVRSA
jgi:hypothetical protein